MRRRGIGAVKQSVRGTRPLQQAVRARRSVIPIIRSGNPSNVTCVPNSSHLPEDQVLVSSPKVRSMTS